MIEGCAHGPKLSNDPCPDCERERLSSEGATHRLAAGLHELARVGRAKDEDTSASQVSDVQAVGDMGATIGRLARSFAAEWCRPDAPEHATPSLVDTLSTSMLAFHAVARGVEQRAELKSGAAETRAAMPQRWQILCPMPSHLMGTHDNCSWCDGSRFVSIYRAKDFPAVAEAAAPAAPQKDETGDHQAWLDERAQQIVKDFAHNSDGQNEHNIIEAMKDAASLALKSAASRPARVEPPTE